MPQCKQCEKKGLFLKLDANGYCDSCCAINLQRMRAEQEQAQVKRDSIRSLINERIQIPETFSFKVAGVTFKNGRQSRQTILRHMKFRDPPYDKIVDINLEDYEFDGEPAIKVLVNGDQIGSVPKEIVPFLMKNWDNIKTISDVDVYGGGRSESGEALSYGCEVTLKLLKDIIPAEMPLMKEALEIAAETSDISSANLMRTLKIGYSKAAELRDALRVLGISDL